MESVITQINAFAHVLMCLILLGTTGLQSSSLWLDHLIDGEGPDIKGTGWGDIWKQHFRTNTLATMGATIYMQKTVSVNTIDLSDNHCSHQWLQLASLSSAGYDCR